jgi:hypothetical protein
MKLRTFVFAAIGIACFAASISAQGKPAPKFTSVYTSLKTTCKSFDGSNGSDGYSICRGPGGYKVRIYYSAAATHFNAERKDGSFPIATASVGFEWGKTKLEWRLANGKPFAVIIRIPKYGEPAEGEYYGKVNGQELVVAGLSGFEDLNTKIDAKTAGANSLAREAADSAYLSKN